MLTLADLQVAAAPMAQESWIDENSGSLLLAVAAIVAASLAAYVATRNHRQQLEHDAAMRNREHIRETLDMAVEGAEAAITEVVRFSTVLEPRLPTTSADSPRHIESTENADDEWEDEVGKAMKAAHGSRLPMWMHNVRLELRLGPGHPVVVQHERLRKVLSDWDEVLRSRSKAVINKESLQDIGVTDDPWMEKIRDTFADFRLACIDWFNSR